MSLATSIALAAPYYNLGLVLVALFLFAKLFGTKVANHKVFLKPWYFIYAAMLIFIIEELLTVLRAAQVVQIPFYINGFFELAIISLFIYTLLLQKEHVKA